MSPLSWRCATKELIRSRMAASLSSRGVTRVSGIRASLLITSFSCNLKFSGPKAPFSFSNPVFVQKSDPASNL